MKYPLSVFILMCLSLKLIAQDSSKQFSKTIIDSSAINRWPRLGQNPAISRDGRYFMCTIQNQPVNSSTVIIRSTGSGWERQLPGVSGGVFSFDSKQFVFLLNDTLFFLSLGSQQLRSVPGVGSYGKSSTGRWLVYQLKTTAQEMVLSDFSRTNEQHFSGVTDYLFDNSDRGLLMKIEIESNHQKVMRLEWMALSGGMASTLWSQDEHSGEQLTNYVMSNDGRQVTYITSTQNTGKVINNLWYYREGMNHPINRAGDQSTGPGSELSLNGSNLHFSHDGRYIFFGLVSNTGLPKPAPDAISVDVWSYRDSVLQSAQLNGLDQQSPVVYTAVADVLNSDARIVRLEYNHEKIQATQANGDYVVICHRDEGDRFWSRQPDSNYLVSLKDGSRTLLRTIGFCEFLFSPDARHLVYYDAGQQCNYFSHDLRTGQVKPISATIPVRWLCWADGFEYPKEKPSTLQLSIPAAIAGWVPEDDALLVCDNFDIWELFPEGVRQPLCITNGYGRLHHIRFRIADNRGVLFSDDTIFHHKRDSLLLMAFNVQNKYNGFYRTDLSDRKNPTLLTMGPWTFWHMHGMINLNSQDFNEGMKPLKAENAPIWIVMRNTATEAPNYFLTADFRHFKSMTDLAPQKNYNWLHSELVTWTQPDGITSQGVLYKPEDFDPRKKYPVLFNYYEQLSHRVYEYPQPEMLSDAHINIPWFVSRGYLVFTPDIYYHQGGIGHSALTSVVSAARMLSRLPYVDTHRMGIAGHSWGGAETNYLVTHSHLFAAALSGAAGHNGVDLISNSLSLTKNGENDLRRYEQEDIGATLWQHPGLWIANSPIFQANSVTTPLLIFYCKNDNDWERAVELFIALRRLDKRVWMLQYDHGGHNLNGMDCNDFTIRVTQFFDHYLKGVSAPDWMTKGIPARLKGLETGYGLDLSGRQP